MSDISEKVRPGLYTKLNVSNVTNLATGGIHYKIAPQGQLRPYVIFNRQAAGPVGYNFGFTRTHEDDIWLIKAVTDEDSSSTASPETLGQQILTAAEIALGDSLTLSGAVTWAMVRLQDIPDYKEKISDRMVLNQGFLLRVVAAPV